MFLGTYNGRVPASTTIYYWNPYHVNTFNKKTPFRIADIMSEAQTFELHQRTDQNIKQDEYKQYNQSDLFYKREHPKTLRMCREIPHIKKYLSKNYYQKDGVKCTLPSALEPLQALCSVGPYAYTVSSKAADTDRHLRVSTTSESTLHFGIRNILSEDFGKEKKKKENAKKEHGQGFTSYWPSCECTWDCSMYQQHTRYPSHVLSGVHALQLPKYLTSHTGLEVLPGPYSVLNSHVNFGTQAKKKRSWSRAVFSNLQRKGLEKRFEVQKYVAKPDRRQLAAMLGLTDVQVKVWFQNRRMKWRHAQQKQQTETRASTRETIKKTSADNDICSNICETVVRNSDTKLPDSDLSDANEIVVVTETENKLTQLELKRIDL